VQGGQGAGQRPPQPRELGGAERARALGERLAGGLLEHQVGTARPVAAVVEHPPQVGVLERRAPGELGLEGRLDQGVARAGALDQQRASVFRGLGQEDPRRPARADLGDRPVGADARLAG
jgi:hypothetical protein